MNENNIIFNGGSVVFDSLEIFFQSKTTFISGKRNILHGRNGSGKSTLVRCISGVIPEVYNAEVMLEAFMGKNSVINNKKDVSVLPQYIEEYLLGFPVSEELEYSIAINSDMISAKKDLILEATDIEDLWDRSSAELSDGERQRVSIACALLNSSHWVIFDEWTSHLDDKLVDTINRLISFLVENRYLSTIELISNQENDNRHVHSLLHSKTFYRKRNEVSYDLKKRRSALDSLLDIDFNFPLTTTNSKIVYRKKLEKTSALSKQGCFDIPSGKVGVVTGANGSGKTTLLKSLEARYKNNKRGKVTLVLANPILQIIGKSIDQFIKNVFRELNKKTIEFIADAVSIINCGSHYLR